MVSVIREPATGAMQLTTIFCFLPSSASVFDRPRMPIFTVL